MISSHVNFNLKNTQLTVCIFFTTCIIQNLQFLQSAYVCEAKERDVKKGWKSNFVYKILITTSRWCHSKINKFTVIKVHTRFLNNTIFLCVNIAIFRVVDVYAQLYLYLLPNKRVHHSTAIYIYKEKLQHKNSTMRNQGWVQWNLNLTFYTLHKMWFIEPIVIIIIVMHLISYSLINFCFFFFFGNNIIRACENIDIYSF